MEEQIVKQIVNLNDNIFVKLILTDFTFLQSCLGIRIKEDLIDYILDYIMSLKKYSFDNVKPIHDNCIDVLNCIVCLDALFLQISNCIFSVIPPYDFAVDYNKLKIILFTTFHNRIYNTFKHNSIVPRLKHNLFIKMISKKSLLKIVYYYNSIAETQLELDKIKNENYNILTEFLEIVNIDECISSVAGKIRYDKVRICADCHKIVLQFDKPLKEYILEIISSFIGAETKKYVDVCSIEEFCYSLVDTLTSTHTMME